MFTVYKTGRQQQKVGCCSEETIQEKQKTWLRVISEFFI